ncbi:MAG TPA: AAA family ATPase [Desulfovibrio sp.]|nr:AAA family ATPase [Desulfovibrio sp.]
MPASRTSRDTRRSLMSEAPQRSTMSREDIAALSEDVDLEVKLAAGRDGRGELPDSFFETYSAMANTNGGTVLLGVKEKPKGHFTPQGLPDTANILKKLWDELNNRDKVSANLLSHSLVREVEVEGRLILRIDIPRAPRSSRPVYIGRDPLRGTYRRLHEGDYKADQESVKRMLAEQVEDARDARVLPRFDMDDLDPASLSAYRNVFSSVRPDHPWNALDNLEFLRMIGAWGRNRETAEEGLTLGGLLMFGQLPFILDQLPHYILDYQERSEPRAELRWVDRVTTDGTWPGNLFEFYRIAYRKLTTDLKIPFRLHGDRRTDDTPVHEALREALVNTLIHADYSGRVSVLVVKRPDMFGFRNPGTSRIPLAAAIRGGESDCRNRKLQKMFQLAGLGEQAGSGIPKIYQNWRGQQWFPPKLYEKNKPEQTLLEMSMHSFIPEEISTKLQELFGDRIAALTETERLALALAAADGTITHPRFKDVAAVHPGDASKVLSHLVREGFLESSGTGRGTVYSLPGTGALREKTLRERYLDTIFSDGPNPAPDSVHSNLELACLPDPLIYPDLHVKTAAIRARSRAPRLEVERVILDVCAEHYLSPRDLAELLGRAQETLRIHYLAKMVKDGRLELLHPTTPNHPRQRYRAASKGEKP